jgi:hypothetical protein
MRARVRLSLLTRCFCGFGVVFGSIRLRLWFGSAFRLCCVHAVGRFEALASMERRVHCVRLGTKARRGFLELGGSVDTLLFYVVPFRTLYMSPSSFIVYLYFFECHDGAVCVIVRCNVGFIQGSCSDYFLCSTVTLAS